MIAFIRAVRHNFDWDMPFWWSVKTAWKWRKGPTQDLIDARAEYLKAKIARSDDQRGLGVMSLMAGGSILRHNEKVYPPHTPSAKEGPNAMSWINVTDTSPDDETWEIKIGKIELRVTKNSYFNRGRWMGSCSVAGMPFIDLGAVDDVTAADAKRLAVEEAVQQVSRMMADMNHLAEHQQYLEQQS